MNLTQVQIEELQQAWKEGMEKIVAYGVMHFGIGVHTTTKEVALLMDADDLGEIVRVLKHSTQSDVDALQAFLDAGGCNDKGYVHFTETDLKGRTRVPVAELLEISLKKVH